MRKHRFLRHGNTSSAAENNPPKDDHSSSSPNTNAHQVNSSEHGNASHRSEKSNNEHSVKEHTNHHRNHEAGTTLLFDENWFSNWEKHKSQAEKYLSEILLYQDPNFPKHSSISQFFFVLLNHKQKLEESQIVNFVNTIVSTHSKERYTLLIPMVFAFELQWNRINEEDEEQYTYLANILTPLLDKEILSTDILKQLMNFSALKRCGLDIKNMYIKSRTRELYTQDRFNLLHEENEGFSKLISIIIDNENMEISKIERVTKEIVELIGFFNLEPNRVLDILLDAYEYNTENECYSSIISCLFNSQHLRHAVGFKLLGYHSSKSTPKSLFTMIVQLMRKKLLKFEDILDYLGPNSFDDLTFKHLDYEGERKKESREYSAVSLDGSITEKPEPRFERSYPEFQKDQKFGFLIELLNLDVISEAITLLDILSKFDPHWNYDIAIACCTSIEKLINPIYIKRSRAMNGISANLPALTREEIQTLEDLVFPLIYHTKYELYRDVKILSKIIRVLRMYLAAPTTQINHNTLIGVLTSVLSSLCFLGMNTVIVSEFWDVFKNVPFTTRYQVYGLLRQVGYERQPKLMAQQNLVSKNVRLIFNRISFANIKTKAREILQYSLTNPIVVCDEFIRKCENYDNLIPLCVDSAQYTPELFHDTMIYCILDRFLSNERSAIKDDGISIATWLSNLATLCGLFLRTYPFTDITPMLNYLTQRLKEGQWEYLIILTEIIKQTSGLEYSEEISETQLDALAGGKLILTLAGGFSPVVKGSAVESVIKLKDTLLKTGKGLSLLLLLSKLSNYGIFLHDDLQEWKHIADSKDISHTTYLLLLKFLLNEVKFVFEEDVTGSENYCILPLPSIDTLRNGYKLSPSFVFSMARLTMTSIPSNDIEPFLPKEIWSHFSSEFYQFFWMKELSDIFVPSNLYRDVAAENPHYRNALQREKDEQQQKYDSTLKVMKDSCQHYFIGNGEFVDMGILLQHCFLPRALFSAADSLYCAKLVHALHSIEVPKFSLNLFLQTLLSFAPGILLACTEFEARRLGRFTQYLLSLSNRWCENVSEFNKDIKNKPGSFVSVEGLPQLASMNDSDESPFINLDHDTYQRFHFLLMENLLNNCVTLLRSGDHIKIRIALLFLTPLAKLNVFPYYKRHCDSLIDITDLFKDHRVENIKVLANTYTPLVRNIRKKSQDPTFMNSLLRSTVKPTNINIPSKKDLSNITPVMMQQTPNTAVSEEPELSSITPPTVATEDAMIGEFSDSSSNTGTVSPPTLTMTPAIEEKHLPEEETQEKRIEAKEEEEMQDEETSEPATAITPSEMQDVVEPVDETKIEPLEEKPPMTETTAATSAAETIEEVNTTLAETVKTEVTQVSSVDANNEVKASEELTVVTSTTPSTIAEFVQATAEISASSKGSTIAESPTTMNSKLQIKLQNLSKSAPSSKQDKVAEYSKDVVSLLILPKQNPLRFYNELKQRLTKESSDESKTSSKGENKASSSSQGRADTPSSSSRDRESQSSRRIDSESNRKYSSSPSSQHERRLTPTSSKDVKKEEQTHGKVESAETRRTYARTSDSGSRSGQLSPYDSRDSYRSDSRGYSDSYSRGDSRYSESSRYSSSSDRRTSSSAAQSSASSDSRRTSDNRSDLKRSGNASSSDKNDLKRSSNERETKTEHETDSKKKRFNR
ncbi:hypothetical protein FDP41_013118 [Naegleria fowleri]|uniref:THO complex subunit 2 n=1 Tax=Naegleria fowleri TaxID=5763 RepID=A0A6A5C569_NAEFO|nr:uncharacterized protein FDP41_013118 [Naegleria fowleri]KAF0980635.1 hypothetical protein FDP41_013118 [Naegleria fowleri]